MLAQLSLVISSLGLAAVFSSLGLPVWLTVAAIVAPLALVQLGEGLLECGVVRGGVRALQVGYAALVAEVLTALGVLAASPMPGRTMFLVLVLAGLPVAAWRFAEIQRAWWGLPSLAQSPSARRLIATLGSRWFGVVALGSAWLIASLWVLVRQGPSRVVLSCVVLSVACVARGLALRRESRGTPR